MLRCQVLDEVDGGDGTEQLRMPMTQVWVRYDDRWVCLVGHTDPIPSNGFLTSTGPKSPEPVQTGRRAE